VSSAHIGIKFMRRDAACGMLLARVTTISRSDPVGTVQSMQLSAYRQLFVFD
jgi:hypothetical protein